MLDHILYGRKFGYYHIVTSHVHTFSPKIEKSNTEMVKERNEIAYNTSASMYTSMLRVKKASDRHLCDAY